MDTIRSTPRDPNPDRGATRFCRGLACLVLAVGLAGLLSAPAPAQAAGKPALTVMTRNIYVGGDILAIAGATTLEEFLAAARAFLAEVAASDFPERADALAAEIADKRPDIVGLQEVYDFQLNGANAGVPFVNYLEQLLAALQRHGAHYVVVAKVKNSDLLAPADLDGNGVPESMVRVVDRDVILARAGVPALPLPISTLFGCRASENGCNYAVAAETTVPGLGKIRFERGYVGAAVVAGGRQYWAFNTHLEVREPDPGNPYSRVIQAAQATELKTVVDYTPANRRLVITGDLNSSPDDPVLPVPPPLQTVLPPSIHPPYRQLSEGVNYYGAPLGTAFWDAWTLRPGRPPGLTCCEDADLLNVWPVLYERIDLVFSREAPGDVKANLVGNETSDRTPSGLWPSDHAGVVVRYWF